MGTPTTIRRIRVPRRFGQAPRYVFASSQLYARLTVRRLERPS